MAWKECTEALNAQGSVFINLDNVAKMMPHAQGTLVIFIGLDEVLTIVKESPRQILS